MTARYLVTQGLRGAWRRPRLLFGLLLVSVIWAAAWTWPFAVEMTAATGRRPFAASLAQGLQVDVLAEVVARRPSVGRAAGVGLAAGVVGWVVLSWFLTAGIIDALRRPPVDLSLSRFTAAAGDHGLALGRLQLLSLLPYAVALTMTFTGAAALGWAGRRATAPWVPLALGAAGAVPGGLAWLWCAAAVDVARTRVVLTGRRVVWRAFLEALLLVPREPRRLVGIQLWGGLLWGLLTAGGLAVAWCGTWASAGAFLALLVIRQAVAVLRLSVRVGVFGATVRLLTAEDAG